MFFSVYRCIILASFSSVSSQVEYDLETQQLKQNVRPGAPINPHRPVNLEEPTVPEKDNRDWESKLRCTVFKPRRFRPVESVGGIDSSAPETTSSDNSPTMVRRQQRGKNLRETDSGSGGDSSSDSRGNNKVDILMGLSFFVLFLCYIVRFDHQRKLGF